MLLKENESAASNNFLHTRWRSLSSWSINWVV